MDGKQVLKALAIVAGVMIVILALNRLMT